MGVPTKVLTMGPKKIIFVEPILQVFYSIGTTQDKSLPNQHFLQTLSLPNYS